jgi:uncharacterized membrane protein YfcA
MSEALAIDAVLAASAFAAGIINARAGGGTLLSFPALLMFVPPVVANATSTVALVPGSLAGALGYRRQLRAASRWLPVLTIPSLLGGIIGALLVTRLDERYFDRLVPWLILGATLLFAGQPLIGRLIGRHHGVPGLMVVIGVMTFQFLVAVYGGYFGAGIGILMLGALALLGLKDIHQMNGLKTLLAACINAMSVVVFVAEGKVAWRHALIMCAAAIAGGYVGARGATRVSPRVVRQAVIMIGFALTAYFFWLRMRASAAS